MRKCERLDDTGGISEIIDIGSSLMHTGISAHNHSRLTGNNGKFPMSDSSESVKLFQHKNL